MGRITVYHLNDDKYFEVTQNMFSSQNTPIKVTDTRVVLDVYHEDDLFSFDDVFRLTNTIYRPWQAYWRQHEKPTVLMDFVRSTSVGDIIEIDAKLKQVMTVGFSPFKWAQP